MKLTLAIFGRELEQVLNLERTVDFGEVKSIRSQFRRYCKREDTCEANQEDLHVASNIRDEANAGKKQDGSSDLSVRKCLVRKRSRR
jgi:hypothetical protein